MARLVRYDTTGREGLCGDRFQQWACGAFMKRSTATGTRVSPSLVLADDCRAFSLAMMLELALRAQRLGDASQGYVQYRYQIKRWARETENHTHAGRHALQVGLHQNGFAVDERRQAHAPSRPQRQCPAVSTPPHRHTWACPWARDPPVSWSAPATSPSLVVDDTPISLYLTDSASILGALRHGIGRLVIHLANTLRGYTTRLKYTSTHRRQLTSRQHLVSALRISVQIRSRHALPARRQSQSRSDRTPTDAECMLDR